MPEKGQGTQRLRRANTDGKVLAPKKVDRGSVPEQPPFDPWASDSEDDSNANRPVIKPTPRRKIPSTRGRSEGAGTRLDVPSGRPNPLLANQNTPRSSRTEKPSEAFYDLSTPETNASPGRPGDRASPWSGSRSPSRPNPLLPSSRSPSVSKQVSGASMTPRGDRSNSRKRTDGSPRTPETTDPALYLQSLLQETPSTTADQLSPLASPPSPPAVSRTEMRHKGVARSLSRLYSEEESSTSKPKARATQMPQEESTTKARKEDKPRGRSQPSRRTETKAPAESGGLPVGTPVKARKTTTSKPRKAPAKTEQAKVRPAPQVLGSAQESPKDEIEIKIDQVDLGSSSRTNELMTTFGDDLSFTNESPSKVIQSSPELHSLEVPLPSEQRAAFGQKVYSFQDELEICHKMPRSWSALQAAAPAIPQPPNPYDFQKPVKGKLTGDGKVIKDGQSSRTPNTHVRFPRLAEILRSGKAVDRSQRPIPEYGELTCIMQAQMVLGHSWTADASMTSVALHLLQWFLPYVLLLGVLLIVAIVVLGPSEAFFALLPLPVLLPLQQLRCKTWNKQLLGAVDKAAFADAFDQLRAPLGWGEDGQVFSANLNAAMQALSLPPGELLTSMRGRFDWRLYVLCPLVLTLPALLYVSKGDSQNLEAAEVPMLLLCAFTMLVACSPGKETRRSELVDRRLEALETAFNALLDTLRPLLGSAAQPTSGESKVANSSAGVERFSVRMITSERFTLRGTLTISQEECSLQISCPLASFNLVASGLEGAVQTELGRCAAGEVDCMAMSPPRAQGGSWAASLGMSFSRSSPDTRTRRDDDLASVSTASTLTRGKNQVDEASLHLALAMVTALNRRPAEPLEVFFAKTGTFMAPPKAAYDEPAVVLALAEDQLTCYAGFGAFGPEIKSGQGRCFKQGPSISKERFGVVRDPSEMRQLCTDEEQGALGRSTSVNLNIDESPRSYAASQGSNDSEDEDTAGCKWPSSTRSNGRYAKLFSAAPRHLALVFDTFAARDRCLEAIRETLPLPLPAGRTKCFPAEP